MPRPASPPTLRFVAETIPQRGPVGTDTNTRQPVAADVYINGVLTFQSVTQFQVILPLDNNTEIRVVAPGYLPWGVIPRGGGVIDKVVSGPIELIPEE